MQPLLYILPPFSTPVSAYTLHRLSYAHRVPIVGRMDIEKWFNDLTGNASLREAAETSGVSKSTLSRNLDAGRMTPETIIVLCRAFDRSPIAGLIEHGYLYAHEVDSPSVAVALEKATNEQLLDEIMRRSDPEARYLFGADEDTIGLADGAEVFELPTSGVDAGSYDGTVKDFDWSQPHAADSSADEQAEREKRGEDPID